MPAPATNIILGLCRAERTYQQLLRRAKTLPSINVDRRLKPIAEGRGGFTLIELMVVVSILGVLAAIVVPVVVRQLGESQDETYSAQQQLLQRVVDQYVVDDGNPLFQGRPQFPIFGAAKGAGPYYTGDVDLVAELIVGATANALAGTVGGTPVWSDDGSGVREGSEDVLNDEDTLASVVGWHVAPIAVAGVTNYVDSRDYFVDFDLMLNETGEGFLRVPPESASEDNCSESACTGSYIYYIDAVGNMKTLLASFPATSTTGFQPGVFP